MDKLKRNKTLDGLLMDYAHEQIHIFKDIIKDLMADYKKCETNDSILTSAEAENIISALKSMPGFSMEKFMMILSMVATESNLTGYGIFVNTLSVIYCMLSITNPELFDDYEEKLIFNPDGNYASEFIKRKLKEKKPNA